MLFWDNRRSCFSTNFEKSRSLKATSRFRITTPRNIQRITTYSPTTSRTRTTKLYNRKNPTRIIEPQELNPIITNPSLVSQYARIPATRPSTRRGSIHADQSIQSTNQQPQENKKINEETTRQIIIKPTRTPIINTTPKIFFEVTSPRTRYISTTPIILTTTNRFAIKKTQKIFPTDDDYPTYYDEKQGGFYLEQLPKYTKVILHSNGIIECLDQGSFPHPASCKKFISCAKMENGKVLGWEYTCPKNLSFDPIGGMCNWSAGLGCNE